MGRLSGIPITVMICAAVLTACSKASAEDLMMEKAMLRPGAPPILTRAEHEAAMRRAPEAIRATAAVMGNPGPLDTRWVVLRGVDTPSTEFVFCGSIRTQAKTKPYDHWRSFVVLIQGASTPVAELKRTEVSDGTCPFGPRLSWTEADPEFEKAVKSYNEQLSTPH
jgi:hypothetical protein